MRLLIISFYFRPDLSAGSFRTTALVEALRERAPPDVKIDVITTLPNRYKSFAREAAAIEEFDRGTIQRIALPPHASDMAGQARAFMHFARRARMLAARQQYDLVFATSSRLMSATLGAVIARRQKALLYLDIRDIFVDTIGDVLPGVAAAAVRAAFARVEAWTVRRADRINLVSPGFEGYFRSHYGARSFGTFTNGIDEEFLGAAIKAGAGASPVVTILYAGNIGEGQGLHHIVPELAIRLRGRARIVIIGDGGRRQALETAIRLAKVDNIELRAPISRRELLEQYHAADVLLLHLGPQAAFLKVLPSKIFEYAALGKPILAGVAGYAARFIRQEVVNAEVFPPGDARAATDAFARLSIQDQLRPDFVAKFARRSIMGAMADDLLRLAASASSPRA